MNVNIEKITNGYLVTIDGVKTFHDVPEAICGQFAELILEHCKRLDARGTGEAEMAKQILRDIQHNKTVFAQPNPPWAGIADLTTLWKA